MVVCIAVAWHKKLKLEATKLGTAEDVEEETDDMCHPTIVTEQVQHSRQQSTDLLPLDSSQLSSDVVGTLRTVATPATTTSGRLFLRAVPIYSIIAISATHI